MEEAETLLAEDMAATASNAWLNVGVAFAYGSASVVTTLANKALLSSWHFDFISALLLLQNALTVVVVVALRRPCIAPAAGTALAREFDFPLWSYDAAVAMLPVMFVCIANLVCGMLALQLSSVPVYQTLKRMTPLPAMALDYLLRGKRFSTPVCLSVLIVCAGALLTGLGDLDFTGRGYASALASCMLQALYLVLASRASDVRPLSSTAASYYNALLSLPLLVFGLYYELPGLLAFGSWGDLQFLGMLLLDLVLGAALSLLLFACTLVNSALTTTIVGNAKAVAATALGAVLFGRVGLSPLGWLGVCVNTAGGVLYSVAKIVEKRPAAAAAARRAYIRT